MKQHRMDASSTPHAPQGGTSLAQRKESRAGPPGKSRKKDQSSASRQVSTTIHFDDAELLVRDNPEWDECWVEMIPHHTFPLSNTEELHHE